MQCNCCIFLVILLAYLSNRCCHWLDIQTVEFMSNLHNFDRQPIYAIGRFTSFLFLTPRVQRPLWKSSKKSKRRVGQGLLPGLCCTLLWLRWIENIRCEHHDITTKKAKEQRRDRREKEHEMVKLTCVLLLFDIASAHNLLHNTCFSQIDFQSWQLLSLLVHCNW